VKRPLLGVVIAIALFWPFSASAMASSHDRLQVNGIFDLEYEKADGPGNSDPTKAVGDEKGSFDQYHFNILLEFPVSDNLTVKGHIEYEHAPQLTGSGGQGEIKMEWAYVEYIVSNNLQVHGGMVLTPFGFYNEIHDATPTFLSIRTPWGIYRSTKVGSADAMFPKFSTGIFAVGSYFSETRLSLHYDVYVANGENVTNNEAERDDNSNKAVGGRLMLSPITGINIGGSYYDGKKQTGVASQADHTAWAVSAEYIPYPVSFRGEYAVSKLGDVAQVGWYGEGSYTFGKIRPYVRYGVLDPDTDIDDDRWTEWVYGINYQIQPNLFLKVEDRQIGGDSANTAVNQDYNELAAALCVAF
jgi:hypothetical protein